MDNRIEKPVISLALCLILTACSSSTNSKSVEMKSSTAPTAPAGPPEPVAAQSAYFEMYKPARQWSSDVMPLSLAAGEVPGIKNAGGKAGMWTAVFVSPSKREARTLFYSVTDSGSAIRKGVSIGGAQVWSGATPKSKPFSTNEFSVNSDVAYATASQKADAWIKKNPGKVLSIYLGSEARFAGPVWYFMWGDKKSGYLAFVSATTGLALTGK